MAGTVRFQVVRPAHATRHASRPVLIRPLIVSWGRRYGAARGLYRVFGTPCYRLYRSNVGPPAEGDTPFATASALPATPGSAFADGTWWLSVSYFDGVLDSGFLPIGVNGQTYRKLVIAAGGTGAVPPAAPLSVSLQPVGGGVVRVTAIYAETGANRADTWAIAYTLDGTAPAAGAPTATKAFKSTSAPETLTFDLPAQPGGTTVRVLVQTRRGLVYSDAGSVLSLVVNVAGPSAVPGGGAWRGILPEGTA